MTVLSVSTAHDIVVIDDPDAPIAFDEDEHMRQVQVMGLWHRRTLDASSTACGVQYHSQFCVLRSAVLADAELLCVDCFTQHERKKAEEADAKKHAQ